MARSSCARSCCVLSCSRAHWLCLWAALPSVTLCRDLVFPHHENEIAQTQASASEADRQHMPHGRDFVRYWVHNGFVNGVLLFSSRFEAVPCQP